MKSAGHTHIEYSNDIKDVSSSFEEYNARMERKTLTVFNDLIADKISSKNSTQQSPSYLLEVGN